MMLGLPASWLPRTQTAAHGMECVCPPPILHDPESTQNKIQILGQSLEAR